MNHTLGMRLRCNISHLKQTYYTISLYTEHEEGGICASAAVKHFVLCKVQRNMFNIDRFTVCITFHKAREATPKSLSEREHRVQLS